MATETQPPAGRQLALRRKDPDVERAVSRQRGLTRLSRLQTLGVVFGLFGLWLLRVAGVLPSDDVIFAIGLGDAAPEFPVDPPNAVLGIAVIFLLAGALALAERWTKRYAAVFLVVAAALFAPLLLICAMALSDRGQTNLLPLITESLRLGTPIALGALAGLWCERSGVVNIGIEGMMLTGAGIGFMVYAVAGAGQEGPWLYLAVVAAAVVGGLMAAVHAALSVTFRTDQIVSGVAINLLAIGITSFVRRQVILPSGVRSAATLPDIDLPGLSSIPVVGEQLFSGKPIFLSMFVIFVLTQITLFRTAWGLRVRSVGENPLAAETAGLSVVRTRYLAVVTSGLLAAAGGAYLSIGFVHSFSENMTIGKGFIALAVLIVGRWRPGGALAAALLFGFFTALAQRLPVFSPSVATLMQALPYLVTLIAVAGLVGRSIAPAALGRPLERS